MRDHRHSCGHAAAGLCRARAPLHARRGARRIAGHAVLRSWGRVWGGGRCGAVCDPRRLPTKRPCADPPRCPSGMRSIAPAPGPRSASCLARARGTRRRRRRRPRRTGCKTERTPRVLTNGVPTAYPVRSTTGLTAQARPVGLARPAGRDLLGGEERCVLHAHSRRPGLRWDTPPTTMLTPPTPCASRTDTAHGIAACDVRQRHAHRTACGE